MFISITQRCGFIWRFDLTISLSAGSVPSLAAGLLFGGLAGFGAYKISQNSQDIWVSLGWYFQLFMQTYTVSNQVN